MTEEQPNEPNPSNEPTSQIEKLLIDDPSNFQFHAAYMVYSDTFDANNDAKTKKDLNQNLEDLKENKIDAQTFYVNISRFTQTRSADGKAWKIHGGNTKKERLAHENSKVRAHKKTQEIETFFSKNPF